jgi:hypothetical protein
MLLEYLPMLQESLGGLVRAPGGSETRPFLLDAPRVSFHALEVSGSLQEIIPILPKYFSFY